MPGIGENMNKQKLIVYGIAALAIIGLIAVAIALFSSGQTEGGAAAAAAAATALATAEKRRRAVRKEVESAKEESTTATRRIEEIREGAESEMNKNVEDIADMDTEEKANLGDDLLG